MEGEGCFSIRKKDYMPIFSITQSSKDLNLISSIRDFIYDLSQIGHNNFSLNSIRLETQEIPGKSSIIRLVISQQELIKNVMIPFFDNLS